MTNFYLSHYPVVSNVLLHKVNRNKYNIITNIFNKLIENIFVNISRYSIICYHRSIRNIILQAELIRCTQKTYITLAKLRQKHSPKTFYLHHLTLYI